MNQLIGKAMAGGSAKLPACRPASTS